MSPFNKLERAVHGSSAEIDIRDAGGHHVVRRAKKILRTETVEVKGNYLVRITYVDLKGKTKTLQRKGLYVRSHSS